MNQEYEMDWSTTAAHFLANIFVSSESESDARALLQKMSALIRTCEHARMLMRSSPGVVIDDGHRKF